MAVKRVRVEVEIPEGLDERDIIMYLERILEKLRIPARVVSVKPKDTLTGEEERLLKEIKRGVARRAEKRIESGAKG